MNTPTFQTGELLCTFAQGSSYTPPFSLFPTSRGTPAGDPQGLLRLPFMKDTQVCKHLHGHWLPAPVSHEGAP